MRYFLDTTETIPEGVGFQHFDAQHWIWILVSLVFFASMCIAYRRCKEAQRKTFRHVMAYALLGNEVFKQVCLLIAGNWLPKYLPLHMCSLNIFLITWHAFRPNKLLGNYLYAVGVPTAAIAIVYPTWTALPVGNFMYWHSFTVHMCLAVYPLMLMTGGDIRPHVRYMPLCIGFAFCLAVPVYVVNLLLDTNFMFLMYADKGNPLLLFEQLMGHHLWGLPILGVLLLSIMYLIALPAWLPKKRKAASVEKQM